ncbi:hypothetical protein R3P38DRAFT_1116543 [Favolaschia claudopus]|uniref:Uncharacterized protein n=1 Tax=Favolaschia claudopus TaxID=2862362 RepID=A0AAW0BBN7_9AGAR
MTRESLQPPSPSSRRQSQLSQNRLIGATSHSTLFRSRLVESYPPLTRDSQHTSNSSVKLISSALWCAYLGACRLVVLGGKALAPSATQCPRSLSVIFFAGQDGPFFRFTLVNSTWASASPLLPKCTSAPVFFICFAPGPSPPFLLNSRLGKLSARLHNQVPRFHDQGGSSIDSSIPPASTRFAYSTTGSSHSQPAFKAILPRARAQ